MDERRKQEDEQLHRGHALVEEFGASVLVLLQQKGPPDPAPAAMRGSRPTQRRARGGGGALVAQRLQEAHDSAPTADSASTAAAAARPAVAQSGLVVALLGGVQQHPVQRVQQLGLGHAQFVLVTWLVRTGGVGEEWGGQEVSLLSASEVRSENGLNLH